jgi:hypothetical protein
VICPKPAQRIIRKLSPWPGIPQLQRNEHYYYDGIRRISEVFTDPLSNTSDDNPVPMDDEPGATPPICQEWAEQRLAEW